MVSFEWYRSFVAVYRNGTVAGAAQTLFLTQPEVSHYLSALEASLGGTLFYRTPRRMVPTDEGHRLYGQVADAVQQLEVVSAPIAGSPQVIRLGAPKEFFTERVLHRLTQEDQTLYTIRFGLAQELIEQVVEGELDLAIATKKITHADIDYQQLYQENFWLVGAATTTLPPQLSTNLSALEQWLTEQPWLAYSEELPIIRQFWHMVFDRRIDVNPRLIIPDLRGIRTAVEKGLGLSILPDYLCEDWVASDRLKILYHPQQAVTNEIWLVFRKTERQTSRTQLMLKLLSP